MNDIKLTQYSHGAGCGCKISPQVLDVILKGNITMPDNDKLLVGNSSKDDAAVLDLGNGTALISTTDFFMPIVDDPYNFGRIASANAISDVYAMGGKPVLAIAILGWPIDKLAPEVAQRVIDGSKSICKEAGISLGGGHSIDSPEPIFGLAVNGIIDVKHVKQNDKAEAGNILFLTKPIGVGILTTAEKKSLLKPEHKDLAANQMMELNKIGEVLGKLDAVTAMTDVTGFGLLGHLTEMAEGSNVSAVVDFENVPLITNSIIDYIKEGAVPGGTNRNWDSYGHKIGDISDLQRNILADPQTSGGLLVAVKEERVNEVTDAFKANGLSDFIRPIGRLVEKGEKVVEVR
ncbi:MAG: selenide,water dikinase [Spirosomataceae bacterium]|jgi:selenide,water dikinase